MQLPSVHVIRRLPTIHSSVDYSLQYFLVPFRLQKYGGATAPLSPILHGAL